MGLGFKVWGLGSRVKGLGLRVLGLLGWVGVGVGGAPKSFDFYGAYRAESGYSWLGLLKLAPEKT